MCCACCTGTQLQDVTPCWEVSSLEPLGGRSSHSLHYLDLVQKKRCKSISWSQSLDSHRFDQDWIKTVSYRDYCCAHGPTVTLGHSMQRDVPRSLGLTMLLALSCPCLIPYSWKKGVRIECPLDRTLADQSIDISKWFILVKIIFLLESCLLFVLCGSERPVCDEEKVIFSLEQEKWINNPIAGTAFGTLLGTLLFLWLDCVSGFQIFGSSPGFLKKSSVFPSSKR